MRSLHPKVTAEMDGEFVVLLIGMRINKPWKVHKWVPVFVAMPRMLRELSRHPESGLLGYQAFPGIVVQYWRSFDHLEAYARGNGTHRAAWASFYKRVGVAGGDVGIWHETYLVRAGEYEAIYSGMPRVGLGRVGKLVPATAHRESARGRVSQPKA